MKILVAPLNWGLGHATRVSVLIDRYLAAGDEVTIAGDGQSFAWLRARYPQLNAVSLPDLDLHYSRTRRQIPTLLMQMPKVLLWLWRDHKALAAILENEHYDLVVSDNRFAFFSSRAKCVYVTHQLSVISGSKNREDDNRGSATASAVHRWFINHYDECWVPDYKDSPGLAGCLSHPENTTNIKAQTMYIGPLSRLGGKTRPKAENAPAEGSNMPRYVAVLSGLEPQRTILERELLRRWHGMDYTIVRGVGQNNSTHDPRLLDNAGDDTLTRLLTNARHIVCRGGYSTIMDLEALGLLHKTDVHIEFVPTPGQPEQEYLAALHSHKAG